MNKYLLLSHPKVNYLNLQPYSKLFPGTFRFIQGQKLLQLWPTNENFCSSFRRECYFYTAVNWLAEK